jgi:HK97 gp10 family phage protein
MKFGGKVSGFREAHQILQDLPRSIQNRVLQQSCLDGMRSVKKDFKAAAPKHDRGDRSQASQTYGTLASNIRVIRLKRLPKGQKGARIDTGEAFWGYFYEKGTRHQPARPWFLPAFQRAQTAITTALVDSIIKRIAKEIERVRK